MWMQNIAAELIKLTQQDVSHERIYHTKAEQMSSQANCGGFKQRCERHTISHSEGPNNKSRRD